MSNLGFVLTADTSTLLARMVEAGTVTDREAKKMQRSLQYVSDQLKVMNSAQKAANDSGAAIAESGKHMEKFGFQTASAKRELLVLTHELSQGNYSRFGGSLLVLAERTNAMELAMSGAGAAIGATILLLGGFAAAALIGAHEQEQFRNSLILTGNAAGLTEGRFRTMAQSLAVLTNSTVGSGKAALQLLVDTGRFGQSSIEAAAQALIIYEKLTGQDGDKIAGDFAKMSDGVAKWAYEHNKQYHYLTVEQFKYIKQLEDQGRVEQAEVENFKLLIKHGEKSVENLGYLQRAWKTLGEEASKTWDAMLGIGRKATPEETIQRLLAQLGQVNATKPGSSVFGGDSEKLLANRRAAIIAQLQDAGRQLVEQEKVADATAKAAVKNEAAIKAIMDPPKTKLDPKAYADLLTDLGKYNAESDAMAGHTKKLADYQVWAAEQVAKLTKETEKLTLAEREGGIYLIDAAAQRRRNAEETQRSMQMEAEMQKLLSDRDLVSGPKNSFDTEKQTAITHYLNTLPNDAKRAEQLVGGSFQRMEDAIVNFAKTGKLSFSDLFSFMAEEYLRNLIHMGEKKYLTNESGGFVGFGSLLSSIGGLFSGNSHAGGLDYVPYDGYPAILHKGERVQTAVEARGSSSSGSGGKQDNSVNIGSVGAGVSRAEMFAAIKQAMVGQAAVSARQRQQGIA